jgi:hypothetical protein
MASYVVMTWHPTWTMMWHLTWTMTWHPTWRWRGIQRGRWRGILHGLWRGHNFSTTHKKFDPPQPTLDSMPAHKAHFRKLAKLASLQPFIRGHNFSTHLPKFNEQNLYIITSLQNESATKPRYLIGPHHLFLTSRWISIDPSRSELIIWVSRASERHGRQPPTTTTGGMRPSCPASAVPRGRIGLHRLAASAVIVDREGLSNRPRLVGDEGPVLCRWSVWRGEVRSSDGSSVAA